MSYHEQFLLRVTAGPTYDPSTHNPVIVNTSTPTLISNDHVSARLHVRIKDYRGLPPTSPPSSPYFSHPLHTHDRYSISFSFTPTSPIPGDALVFGNDFDHPVRDRLPPGFGTALRIVRWAIDPGLDGDVYADMPYLYGPLLSSINVLNIGDKTNKEEGDGSKGDGEKEGKEEEEEEEVLEEGAEGDGWRVRKESGMPDDSGARKKYFLVEERRKAFEFEGGRVYRCDFFNPYLDFNEFALRLPGFTLPIIKYWDGQPLRYVLKNRASGAPLFVIVFALVPRAEAKPEPQQQQEPDGVEAKQETDAQAETDAQPDSDSAEPKGETKHDAAFVDEDVD